jgi:pantoate--beta-alanine ligase
LRVIKNINDWKDAAFSWPRPYGLVPTMGCLHDGHLTLIKKGRLDNATLIASVFVNPTQFGSTEDFKIYPQDIEADLCKLDDQGVDIVFMPCVQEMYPAGFDTYVDVGQIASRLEGQYRPEHFRGVATIVSKLFSIFQPTRAYFGQKDFQQSLVIKHVSKDLNLNVDVVVVSTARESDGLAFSSRNSYLKKDERVAATVLYKALTGAIKLYESGLLDVASIRNEITRTIESEPLAMIDYVSISDAQTLVELKQIDRQAVAAVAVRFGETRLLDNVYFDY